MVYFRHRVSGFMSSNPLSPTNFIWRVPGAQTARPSQIEHWLRKAGARGSNLSSSDFVRRVVGPACLHGGRAEPLSTRAFVHRPSMSFSPVGVIYWVDTPPRLGRCFDLQGSSR